MSKNEQNKQELLINKDNKVINYVRNKRTAHHKN